MKIEFKNVYANYKNNTQPILKNTSFKINEGEMVAIIGKSGAGKTTIFNSILRLTKITSGEILVDGKNINSYSNKQQKMLLKKIGLLSQNPFLIEDECVYDSILRTYTKYKNWFYDFFKIVTKKQRQEIFETLNNLDIFDKTFEQIKSLSGGQKQRVEIVKLLLKEVSLILADEPTTSLDIEMASSVIELLKKLNETYKITIIINMHDLNLVKKYFKKIICLKNGEIIKVCEPNNMDNELLQMLYN